jgi:hypothetical protein
MFIHIHRDSRTAIAMLYAGIASLSGEQRLTGTVYGVSVSRDNPFPYIINSKYITNLQCMVHTALVLLYNQCADVTTHDYLLYIVDSLVTRNPKGTRKTTESLLTTHHSTLQ